MHVQQQGGLEALEHEELLELELVVLVRLDVGHLVDVHQALDQLDIQLALQLGNVVELAPHAHSLGVWISH